MIAGLGFTTMLEIRKRERYAGSADAHFGTAVFDEKSDQPGSLTPVDGVIDEPPRAPSRQQSRACQRVKVMRECGPRHLEAALDLVNASSIKPSSDELAKNCEAVFLSQSRKLFDAFLHSDISSIIETLIAQACRESVTPLIREPRFNRLSPSR